MCERRPHSLEVIKILVTTSLLQHSPGCVWLHILDAGTVDGTVAATLGELMSRLSTILAHALRALEGRVPDFTTLSTLACEWSFDTWVMTVGLGVAELAVRLSLAGGAWCCKDLTPLRHN